jgi:acyl-CoA synthetase (AMP-forming)/AMP-acid ligase II
VLNKVTTTATSATGALRVLRQAGLLAPVRPSRLTGMALAVMKYGITPTTAYVAGAVRHGDRVAVIDDNGATTYAELDSRSNAAARFLRERGINAGDRVALLARNSVEFLVALIALGKLGTTVVHLNTGFAGPALATALDDENVAAVVYDEEFTDLVAAGVESRTGITTEQMTAGEGDDSPLPSPGNHGGQVILTSGTTGRAKGAERTAPGGLGGLESLTALLSAIPLRAGEPTVVAAPMFHTWGFAHLTVGGLLGSTLVVRRRFDAATTVADIAEHKATGLIVVPVMLQRMVDLHADELSKHDTSSLRVVACSGSALPVEVARKFTEKFGDVIYNMYGSTEVAYATVATPEDLREAPGSVGRPLRGAVVQLLDDNGNDVAQGEVGRIFVGNPMTFQGYTSGGDKDRVEGLVATGDVGRFDDAGRLFVDGRDDDMIVSGGENIFPGQVEELLLARNEIADVAVVGVPDEQFGARLVAHVVAANGANVDVEEIRGHVRDNLGRIHVPREVVVHDELPRNATGKVVKRDLRQPSES